jgi:hypothetical protein
MAELSYVLPLRSDDGAGSDELTAYLRRLGRDVEVIVVDGSPPSVFEEHARAWTGFVRHGRPDSRFHFVMPKVDGVLTGVELASHDRVIVADDDVRYGPEELRRMSALLDQADLVWPQNYFDPMPWHALWDTSRTLLNRAFGHDYPGTVGVRRSTLLACGGYDGDVMFENLELRRTIQACGGVVATPLDLYVRRLPPTTKHFWSQRVRQAYDDLALPVRLAIFLAILPLVVAGLWLGRPDPIVVGVGATVLLAEIGRRRAGGAVVLPARASLFAPFWVGERAVTAWLAVWRRVALGGVAYRGGRIRRAATARRVLNARFARDGSGRRDRAPVPRRSTADR